MDYLISAIQSNLDWIVKSFKVNNYWGSSAYRTSWGCWSKSYPETTGYLIPSLLKASKYYDANVLESISLKQIQYFRSLQNADGSFAISTKNTSPNVFDSAQILQGLLCLHEFDWTQEIHMMIQKCYDWFCIELESGKSTFKRYNLIGSYNPLYYTRISWILLETELKLGLNSNSHVKYLFEKQIERWNDDFYNNVSLQPNSDAYSHTVIYALRGLYECSVLLDHQKAKSLFLSELEKLSSIVERNNGLPGHFAGGDYISEYICSTGNLQLALLLLLSKEWINNIPVFKIIKLLVDPVLLSQRKHFFNKGAIPSSIPVYGKYQRFRYTNWTQKFFLDLILELLNQRDINEKDS